MASRYWVGGGSSTNWNATANTNWAATDGGPGNQSVPTTTDDVFFTASSPSPAVISAAITVRSVNCTGFTGTITHNTGVTLTINTGSATSLLFSSGMTYTPATTTSLITFTHTSGTADITSNGKRLGPLTINGAGGTTRLLDALRVDAVANSTLTITAGTFNANNFDVTAAAISSSNSNVRTITMGSGTWTLAALQTAAGAFWSMSTVTNLTFNRNTANVVIASNGLGTILRSWNGNQTINNLTINANSAGGVVAFLTSMTTAQLTVESGNSIRIAGGGTLTSTAAPTFTGIPTRPIAIFSDTSGTIATISSPSGSATLAYGSVRDITASGGATFTATNAYDFGNATGWSITEPVVSTAPTASQIAAAVWDEPTADNVTAGTFGAQLKTVVDAIDAKTTNLPSDPADASVIAARFDALDTSVAAIPEAPTAVAVADEVSTRTLLADIRKVNDIAIDGAGTEGNPFGPA